MASKHKQSRTQGHQGVPVRVHYQPGLSGAQEILRPTLVNIDGHSYRKLTGITFGKSKDNEEEVEVEMGAGDLRGRRPIFVDDEYDEGEDTAIELEGAEPSPNGGYFIRLPVPSVFFKYIIGREGKTKANIEKETKCKLNIPGRGKEGDVVIEGPNTSCLANAKRRVEIVVWTSRNKEPPTHFISIPLNQPQVRERMAAFQEKALAIHRHARGVTAAVFQLPAKLHLTLGVMRLFSAEEEERAKEILKECLEEAVPSLRSEPAVISLRGVACMKDDPSLVDVLYAKVQLTDGSTRLQEFVDTVFTRFLEKAPDLMQREFEREGVKLHATVMNSKFPQSGSKSAESSWQRRPKEGFDARGIFKELGDFDFSEVPLQTVHLSKRREYGPDGFYRCVAEYPLDQLHTVSATQKP